MFELFFYPLIPAVLFGTLNWLYWRKKGYTSKVQLGMNIIVFYAGFYLLIKFILYGNS